MAVGAGGGGAPPTTLQERRDQTVVESMWMLYFRTAEYIPGSDGEHCVLLFAAWFRSNVRGRKLLEKVRWDRDTVVMFNFDDLNSAVPRSWDFAECIR